jgi:hypothetical protein
MYHPNLVAQLQRVDNPKRIPTKGKCDFKNCWTEPDQRLGNIGLPTFGRNRQSRQAKSLRRSWESLEIPPRSFDPRDRSRLSHILLIVETTSST